MQAFAFQPVLHEPGIFRYECIKICLRHDLYEIEASDQIPHPLWVVIKCPSPGRLSSSNSLPLGQENTSNARGMPGGGCLSFDLTGTLHYVLEYFACWKMSSMYGRRLHVTLSCWWGNFAKATAHDFQSQVRNLNLKDAETQTKISITQTLCPRPFWPLRNSLKPFATTSFPELRSPWPAVGKREWEQPFQACAIDADAQWAG